MADYPDWVRLFYLSGVAITIPINIESSDITIPVSIDAATATVDINIKSQDADINFNFADQSVAVFDAAKWFAHQAAQVFTGGSATVNNNTCQQMTSYTVPANRKLFITGLSYSIAAETAQPKSMLGYFQINGALRVFLGSVAGSGLALDTPLVVEPGDTIKHYVCQYGSGANLVGYGTWWGYQEVV